MSQTNAQSNSQTWAILSHVTALLGGLMGGLPAFLGPLVIFLVFRHKDAYVRHHAVESLNFQISVLIYAAISAILIFVLIGFLLLPIVGVAWLVLSIRAAIAAADGQLYRYPFTIRFVH